MDEALDLRQIEHGLAHAIEHTGREIGRRREAFRLMDRPVSVVEGQKIGECAADIDGDIELFQSHTPFTLR